MIIWSKFYFGCLAGEVQRIGNLDVPVHGSSLPGTFPYIFHPGCLKITCSTTSSHFPRIKVNLRQSVLWKPFPGPLSPVAFAKKWTTLNRLRPFPIPNLSANSRGSFPERDLSKIELATVPRAFDSLGVPGSASFPLPSIAKWLTKLTLALLNGN